MKKHSIFTFSAIILSVVLAFWFGESGAVGQLVYFFSPAPWFAAFLAGIGFSSLFTTAPAVVALGGIASEFGIWQTALFGGAGALLGDLALLKAMKTAARTAGKPFGHILPKNRFIFLHRLRKTLSHGPLKLILWATGAMVIASPLPDELGLAIIGVAKIPLPILIVVSYVFNTIGIAAIGIVALSVV